MVLFRVTAVTGTLFAVFGGMVVGDQEMLLGGLALVGVGVVGTALVK